MMGSWPGTDRLTVVADTEIRRGDGKRESVPGLRRRRTASKRDLPSWGSGLWAVGGLVTDYIIDRGVRRLG